MLKFDPTAITAFAVLQTQRLYIGEILPSEAAALFAMQSDALVFKYIAKLSQTELA